MGGGKVVGRTKFGSQIDPLHIGKRTGNLKELLENSFDVGVVFGGAWDHLVHQIFHVSGVIVFELNKFGTPLGQVVVDFWVGEAAAMNIGLVVPVHKFTAFAGLFIDGSTVGPLVDASPIGFAVEKAA